MALTYDRIQSTTLGSAASSIAFTSISSSYTDLRIVMTGKMVTSEQPFLRFNSDTGTNYSYTTIYANGVSRSSFRGINDTRIYVAPLTNWTTTNTEFATIDIFSYAGSTFKSVLCGGSNDKNTSTSSGGLDRTAAMWRSTSALTRIDIIGNGQNFATGFTATLYGILKA